MPSRLALFTLIIALLIAAPLKAQEEDPGQADLDKATELKINATDLSQLNDVIKLLDSALDKGLGEDNTDFAESMLIGSLKQRSTTLAAVLLKQKAANSKQNPQYLQLRIMVVNDLQRIVEIDDTQVDAIMLLGRLQSDRELGNPVAARKALTRVIDTEDASDEVRAQAYALRSVLRSRVEDRLADASRAVELNSEKAEYLIIRAQQLQASKKPEQALADLDKAVELAPENPAVHQLRGMLLIAQENFEGALESFNKVTELAPQDIQSYQMRSQILERLGDVEEAMIQIDKAIAMQPTLLPPRLLRIKLLIKGKRLEEALADANALLEKQPDRQELLIIRVQLLQELGRNTEAFTELEKLAKALPNQPGIHLQIAAHYLDRQQPTKAIASLTRVLELAKDNDYALRLRGDTYLAIGKHHEAIADFARVYESNPEESGLLNNYAWTLATSPFDDLRDGERAVEMATQACELTEYKQPHIVSTLAAAYAEAGDFESAVEWSTKAVEMTKQGVQPEHSEELQKELDSYLAEKPWRELQQETDEMDDAEDETGEEEPEQIDSAPARSLDF